MREPVIAKCYIAVVLDESYESALDAYRGGRVSAAELACVYVAARVRAKGGARWKQGARAPAFACSGLGDAARLFAEERLYRIESAVARALVAWARGERDVDLLFDVPSPYDVLALQACGRRCVSLLADDARAAPHEDGLAFALHDLCHLEKFVDPAHHVAQVGFFAMVDRAMRASAWRAFDAQFDDAWRRDAEHVVADMNGSPIFLFAALKMKLKMASRRALARAHGRASPVGGPLADDEARAFDGNLEAMLDLLDLRGDVRDAAARITTKRDCREDALRLEAYFRELGQQAARV